MVKRRAGSSSLGCLTSLLILSAAIYFGVNVGEVYWRFYQFQDDMRQEVRFAAHSPTDVILARLRAQADEAEDGFGEDRLRHAVGQPHDDRAGRVRQQVLRDDARVRRAQRARGAHEVALA